MILGAKVVKKIRNIITILRMHFACVSPVFRLADLHV